MRIRRSNLVRATVCGVLAASLLLMGGVTVLASGAEATKGRTVLAVPDRQGLGDDEELEEFLDAFMLGQLIEYRITGAVVAVVADGDVLLAKAYGHADIETDTFAVADETLFRLGSVSSLFTWTAVMQLVERGKLDLNADINTYLSYFRIPNTFAQPITLAHLLTHTAGFEDVGSQVVPGVEDLLPLGEALASHVPGRVRPPGEQAAYSYYGVGLAGYIVEQVSGVPFERYVEENLLNPLDMCHTTVRQPVPDELLAHLANGYVYTGAGYAVYDFEFVRLPPAGSMSATAADVANFMIAHLQGGRYSGGRILEEATVLEMQRQHFTHDPRVNGIAYGFYEMNLNGQHIIRHEGDTVLSSSLLALLPEQNEGLFVCYSGPIGRMARDELLKAYMNRYYPLPDQPALQPLPGSAERASRCVGSYRMNRTAFTNYERILGVLDDVVEVVADPDGTLYVTGAKWVEIEPFVFRPLDGQRLLVFHEDNHGRISHMFADKIPTVAFARLAWYETEAFQVGLLATCAALFLSALLSWLIGAFINRRAGRARVPGPHPVSRARLLAALVGGLDLLSMAMLLFTLSRYRANVATNIPSLLLPVMIVEFIAAALTLGVVGFAVMAWAGKGDPEGSPYWSVCGRVHYTLVALAALVYVVWLYCWNLLGFRF